MFFSELTKFGIELERRMVIVLLFFSDFAQNVLSMESFCFFFSNSLIGPQITNNFFFVCNTFQNVAKHQTTKTNFNFFLQDGRKLLNSNFHYVRSVVFSLFLTNQKVLIPPKQTKQKGSDTVNGLDFGYGLDMNVKFGKGTNSRLRHTFKDCEKKG